MADQEGVQESIEAGRQIARRVLEFRDDALQERSAAMAEPSTAFVEVPGASAETLELAAEIGGMSTAGLLIAEGDSWFDYPWNDVLRLLEDVHGYEIESVAHKGDRLEDMAYSGGQLEEFTRRIERAIRRGQLPRAILLSGGGNDIAGDELAMLINHAASPSPGLNESVVRGVIDERLHAAYVTVLTAVTLLVEARIHRRVPIIIHGYDLPVPDGRGFFGGWGPFPGPWLEPSFRRKAYEDRAVQKPLIHALIHRFNDMLRSVAELPDFSHVRYLDLRGTLSHGADYEDWWANELHPTKRGFRAVAARFAAVI